MVNRIKKGIWTELFWNKNQTSNNNIEVSQTNATFWKSDDIDNILTSQYLDEKDELTETYIDKVWRETWISADIQNIDNKILDSYKILSMPDDDIFNNPNLSPEEKIALSNERRDTWSNRISQLRKLQSAKVSEIEELAKFEASKEKAKADRYREAINYQKTLTEAWKLKLEQQKFWLTATKADEDIRLKQQKFGLDVEKFWLSRDKFIASEVKDSDLITWDFSNLNVWNQYWNWKVSQTYGTDSILKSDNLRLANWSFWTPGIDLAWQLWDRVAAFEWWTIVSVTSWQTNIPREQWEETGWSFWNQVVVRDPRGQLHYYNHLDNVGNYQEWQAIQKGQLLWTMWNTWTSTWVHLDYRVKSDRWWEDPRTFMTKAWDWKESGLLFETSFDYINSTIPNVAKKITPETWAKIVISDMQSFNLPKDKLKQLSQLWKISDDLLSDYTSISLANQYWSTLTDDQIVSELKQTDFSNMNDEEKLTELVELALAWKLKDGDDELFEWGFLDIDEPWYEAIEEHFDDVSKSIKEANEIAEKIKAKYNLN